MTTPSHDAATVHDEPHEAADRAGWSVRRYLALFTVALLVPVLVLLAVVFYRIAETERRRLERDASEIAQSIAVAIDRDLTGLFSALDVLTSSGSLARGNFESFHDQAAGVLERQGVETILYDLTGQQLVNARIAWGRPLPKSQLDLDQATLATNVPIVTNLLRDPATGTRQFLIARGVKVGKRLRYIVAYWVPLSRLDSLLADLGIPSRYTATIIDRDKIVMARNRGRDTVGHQAYAEPAIFARGFGAWRGTNPGETPVFTALIRSRLSGFSGLVAISNADLRAPVWRSLGLLAGIGIISAALSTWLALFVARRVTRPIAALSRTAAAVGRGERIEPLATGLSEANQVGKALVGASASLRDREHELREANDELQRFAYIVSHDLRSPLVNIMGFTAELEALREDLFARLGEMQKKLGEEEADRDRELGHDFDEAISFIKTSISKMDRLINAILHLSRAGRREFSPERIDMDALMQSIKASLAIQAEAAHATIEIKPLPSIIGDRLALEQIFSNLVDNALKYLRPDVPGRIEIIGRARGATLVYEVRDNGRGIEAKDLDRVFDLFRRSGVQDRPGEGIGLAHVRALVRRLSGTIALTSEPGAGSTLTVTLPRRWVAPDNRKAA